MLSRSLSRFVWLALLVLLVAAPRAEAQDYSASHLRAAETVLVEAGTEELMTQAIDEMMRAQVQQNPALSGLEEVMRSFLSEYLGWDAIRDDLVRLYAAAFTEDELDEIAAFYRTPTGQKAVATMPSLMVEGMQLGQRKLQEHLPELQRRLRQRLEELGDQP